MSRILITGATGGLARIVSQRLKEQHELIGIDWRPEHPDSRFPGEFFQLDYQNRKVAELFRKYAFDSFVHLGRIPMESNFRKMARFHANVLGTKNLLDLCLKSKVKTVLVMSTFHIYGAHQHNHLYITEEDPLLASHTFPEIADAVELDNISVAFSLKNRSVRTIILRPVNVIGTKIRNQISLYLRGGRCPTVMGYDPMQQFIHESDLAEGVMLALQGKKSGIYNIAGEGGLPMSKAIELAGSKAFPIPEFLKVPAIASMKAMGYRFPDHLIEYFKYPVILSDKAFRRDFGYEPQVTSVNALKSLGG
jgi:UDP-glucose 4-epimerase